MSEEADLSAKPKRRVVRRFAAVAVLLVAAVVMVRGWKVDDATLEKALVGSWTAVDPNDPTFHRREVPVTREQLIFRDDGTLSYVVGLASKPETPEIDLWGWRVRKGRLYVRFLGEEGTGQWLPGLAFSVSEKALSIRIKSHRPKRWVRS